MSLHREDRELQIKLARLQSEIQIYLTAAFGFLAGFFAFIAIFYQFYFASPAENSLVKNITGIGIVLLAFLCLSAANWFIRKMSTARKQFEELRKQYVW